MPAYFIKLIICLFSKADEPMLFKQDYEVGYILHKARGGKLRRVGYEDLTILKLEETIDLSFSSHLSAACFPTCDDMFDVEFQVCFELKLVLFHQFNNSWKT